MTINYNTIQADVVALLQSDPFFQNVFIFAVMPANPQSQVDEALSGKKVVNGKAGAAIEVSKPFGTAPLPSSPGPEFTIEMRFLVKVKPVWNNGANGARLTAEQISLHLVQALQGWGAEGSQSNVFYCAPNFDTPAHFPADAGLEGRLVVMHATCAATPLPRTVTPAPTGDADPGIVTITCAAPDDAAMIVYTTDGSSPAFIQGTTNPAGTGTLYTAPFTVPSGATVRAIALAAGKLPSMFSASLFT